MVIRVKSSLFPHLRFIRSFQHPCIGFLEVASTSLFPRLEFPPRPQKGNVFVRVFAPLAHRVRGDNSTTDLPN